jgi:signal transduction histidine kinase
MDRTHLTESAIRDIREEVVEDVAVVIIVLGTVASIFAALRDLSVGGRPIGLLAPVILLVLLLGLRFLRVRLSASLIGGLLIGGLLVVAFNGLRIYGVSAPAAYLVPTALLMTWMLFGSRVAGWFLAGAAMTFASIAVMVVKFGALSDVLLDLGTGNVSYWLNLGMIQILVATIIIVTLRRLVLGLVGREAQSAHERDRYSGMFEALQDAVFVHSIPDGSLLERNGSSRSMFGLTGPLDFEGEDGRSRVRFPWTVDDVSPHLASAMWEGPQRFVCRGRRPDGKLFWCEAAMRVFPVAGEDRMVVSVRDVDDKIRHQMELQGLNEGLESRVAERTANLERSRKELEAFSYAVAHDLRSPLRAVNGYGKVLQEDCDHALDSTGRMYVERIVAGTVRMGKLIDALLELSRIDRTNLCSVPVEMGVVARECCEELEMAMRTGGAAGGSPRIAWFVGELPDCLSDTELVRQIWANLLSNAFKFSASAQSPRVVVGAEHRDDGIWYSVADNGCGFDMAHSEKLFGVFQRLHDNSVEGLGIGLATVKRILQRMDGEIEFEGTAGRGASFRFRPGPARPQGSQVDQESTSFSIPSVFQGTEG